MLIYTKVQLFLLLLTSIVALDVDSEFSFSISLTDDGVNFWITRGENETDILLTGTLGKGRNFTKGTPDDIHFEWSVGSETVQIVWHTNNTDEEFKDCIDLNKTELNWFGGPERHDQVYPLEDMVIKASDKPWVLAYTDNFAVIEPYWLNSKGVFLYVDPRTPLYIDQNNLEKDRVCFIASTKNRYTGRDRLVLNYTIGIQKDPKKAHLYAVNNHLGKPKAHPGEKMIREPIWTTWAKYKKDINDKIVLDFADDVIAHGYTGQLEIDDNWEKCYGAQEFSTNTFPNITETVKTLHDKNFRVTLWVHPFVNADCNPNAQQGIEKGYFVHNKDGDTKASWWDGSDAHQIDFTNEEAQKWFTDRLNKLKQEHGIDSFKFDAGETDYFQKQPALYDNMDIELVPNIASTHYVRTCAQLGDLIEVRSAWKTQDLPIFVRMLDKDSHWGFDNGLKSLITTLLQMNLNGYVMVLPDMIGGNGYAGQPSAELLVRWAQANVFMPAMQFSYLPWDITSDDFNAEAIIKTTVELHAKSSGDILKAMDEAIRNGTPVNPPIWWADPLNLEAHKVNDEYLLGESILVAPIVEEGAVRRDIYLPSGKWKDGNRGTVYEGPLKIESYDAPIDVLPYFFKQ